MPTPWTASAVLLLLTDHYGELIAMYRRMATQTDAMSALTDRQDAIEERLAALETS